MNDNFCDLIMGNKPTGHKHIAPEVFELIEKMMKVMRYTPPLAEFDSVAVKVDVQYCDFITDWWKFFNPNYGILKPRIIVTGSYYSVPHYDGTGMEELTNCGWRAVIYPNTGDIYFTTISEGYPMSTDYNYVCRRIYDANMEVYWKYHLIFTHNDRIIHNNRLSKSAKKARAKKRVKSGEGVGEMKRGYTDFCRATFLYDDGSTKVVYKHSPTSYTIENIASDGSTFIEVDGPNATDEIFKMITSFYHNRKGHIRRHKDY